MDFTIGGAGIFLTLHIFVVIAYFLFRRTFNVQHMLAEMLIVFFLPVAGVMLMMYCSWIRMKVRREGVDDDNEKHLRKLMEAELNTETISAEVMYSNDIVPLNDVLYLEKVGDKRNLLTTAIRQSALSDSTILKRAIRDEEREVSHYAVSMATNQVSILEKQMNNFQAEWDAKRTDVHYLHQYAEVIKQYIAFDIFDEFTAVKLFERYNKVLQLIYKMEPENELYFEDLINLKFKQKQYAEAESILALHVKRYPENELGYLLLLKTYVSQKRRKDVDALIKSFRGSKIHFSAEGMRLVRYWGNGES